MLSREEVLLFLCMPQRSCQVVVAGGGVVGLFLACLLRQNGAPPNRRIRD